MPGALVGQDVVYAMRFDLARGMRREQWGWYGIILGFEGAKPLAGVGHPLGVAGARAGRLHF